MENIKIYTDEELSYVMGFYEIKKIPVRKDREFVGEVVREGTGVSFRPARFYEHMCAEDAIELAYSQVNDVINLLGKLKEKTTQEVALFRAFRYDSTERWEGTYDELFEKLQYENDHLRYCNGRYYEFCNAKVKEMGHLWYRMIPESRSFAIFYGNGTVD